MTARKRTERLIDVPVAATAFSAQALERYATSDLTSLSAQVPQVRFDHVPTGSGAVLTIRGIGASSLDTSIDSSVAVDVDGVPVTRGRIMQSALLDLDSVDILKGPQALYFGKNSPAGVIVLNSKGPGDVLDGYARVGYEAVDSEGYFEGAIGGPISDHFGMRIAARVSKMWGGWLKNVARPINDPFYPGRVQPGAAKSESPGLTEDTVRVTAAYTPNELFDATFHLLATHYYGAGPGSFVEVSQCAPGATRPSVFGVTDPYGDCKLNGVISVGKYNAAQAAHYPLSNGGVTFSQVNSVLPSLQLNYRRHNLTFTSITGFYYYREGSFGNDDYTVYAQLGGADRETYKSLTQEFRVVSSFDGPLNFTAGFFYQHENRDIVTSGAIFGLVPFGVTADPRNGKENNYQGSFTNHGDTYSLYGELSYKILSNLELSAGARWTHEKKVGDAGYTFINQTFAPLFPLIPEGQRILGGVSEYNLSPQATLSWHPSRDVMIYAAYKTGYKSGGVSNPTIIPKGTTAGDLEFEHESSKGGEIGAKASLLGGRLSGDVTAFIYDYNNLQVTAFNAPTTSFVIQNAATARTEGVEAQGSYQANANLNLRGSVGYTYAHYLSFPAAQCFAGQTVAQGCVGGAQDLKGGLLPRAPLWAGDFGFTFDHPVGHGLTVELTSDLHFTGGYYLDSSDAPFGRQNGFTTVDASLRLLPDSDNWELSVIGRNLTDKYYGVGGVSTPGGPNGQYGTVVARARQVYLQATYHFR